MKPTYEELEVKLNKTMQLLKLPLERIALLEERLNKNTNNSSKPPSGERKGNSPDNGKKLKKRRSGICPVPLSSDQIDHFHNCKLESCLFAVVQFSLSIKINP